MVETGEGLGFGLLVTAFWFGFRHGIDWDHIAAITDIAGSQEDRRQSIVLGTLYVVGHACVVLLLGVIAIVAGERLPESVDAAMTRVVGVTLLALGVYVFVSLVRHGRDFRLRSRWMLVFSGVRRGARWAKDKVAVGARREGDVAAGEPGDPEDAAGASSWHHGHHGRPGHHHHSGTPERDDTFTDYGSRTSFFVGMLHGIGAETPTQILIFATAAGVGGSAAGVAVLAAFIVGLVSSNSVITVGSAFGFMNASKNFAVYATVAVVTAVFSLIVGTLLLLGKDSLLPALFGG
jgi:high-affinity nickel-transport protein